MHTSRMMIGALSAALVSAPAGAQQRGRGRGGAPEAPPPAAMTRMPAVDSVVVTHHSATIGGQKIDYTATTGTYVVRDDEGTPKATFFFAAYTKDGGANVADRPVAFVYNGGPGSASLFTHMGMGPQEVVLTPDGHGMPAPYRIRDNDDSFLDATDLVFVDAVSTGYSRPAAGQNPAQFYGVEQDANIFSDFIDLYITRNGRWDSPKFLIGESYGTTRSAELAGVLEHRHDIYLNGIVLLSTMAFAPWGADDRTEFFLPTYVTSAWYHHLLAPDLEKLSVDSVAQIARTFAHGEYAQALEQGDEISPTEYARVTADMARLTGLSPDYIDEADLRVSPQRWFAQLMRNRRLIMGRLDSRFTGYNRDAASERAEYDPSEASYLGAFTATFMDYVRRDLGWTSDAFYAVSANVRPWDRTALPDVAETLRSAMTEESSLKLLVLCGYYDLATPFNGIEETVSHMGLEPAIRKNVSFDYYASGHMVYIDQKQHDKLHRDVDAFIDGAYSH
ncbi:MAG: peptidase S10 [Gemmatimonadota bacterium]|nr:peptidase S10 [Gemmatimonadota bacterium]